MDQQAVHKALESGLIGNLSFADWLRAIAASTDLCTLAQELSKLGIVSMEWEEGKLWPGEKATAKVFLVVTLEKEHRLSLSSRIFEIVLKLRNPYHYSVKANGWEVWVEFHEPPGCIPGPKYPLEPSEVGLVGHPSLGDV